LRFLSRQIGDVSYELLAYRLEFRKLVLAKHNLALQLDHAIELRFPLNYAIKYILDVITAVELPDLVELLITPAHNRRPRHCGAAEYARLPEPGVAPVNYVRKRLISAKRAVELIEPSALRQIVDVSP
jgi:hypothetical protein